MFTQKPIFHASEAFAKSRSSLARAKKIEAELKQKIDAALDPLRDKIKEQRARIEELEETVKDGTETEDQITALQELRRELEISKFGLSALEGKLGKAGT